MFFVFEGLWWKFFEALEAWKRRASPICGLLRFLETFELDSSDLWDLGRWFGWFLFECSLYSKLKFLKALRLDSCRAFLLLNLGLFPALLQPFRISLKCLRKASIYRILRVGERHVAEFDWWHMLQPGWSIYVITYMRWIACVITYTCEATCVIAYTCEATFVIAYTCEATCVIAYTWEAACVIVYTCADAWLVLAWHLANFH